VKGIGYLGSNVRVSMKDGVRGGVAGMKRVHNQCPWRGMQMHDKLWTEGNKSILKE
jgi:hypothetical protein